MSFSQKILSKILFMLGYFLLMISTQNSSPKNIRLVDHSSMPRCFHHPYQWCNLFRTCLRKWGIERIRDSLTLFCVFFWGDYSCFASWFYYGKIFYFFSPLMQRFSPLPVLLWVRHPWKSMEIPLISRLDEKKSLWSGFLRDFSVVVCFF